MWSSTKTARTGLLGAILALLLVSGCGGGRPSEDEISQALREHLKTQTGERITLTQEQADCAAQVFLRSRISDEGLRAIVDGDRDYRTSRDDVAETQVETDLVRCTES